MPALAAYHSRQRLFQEAVNFLKSMSGMNFSEYKRAKSNLLHSLTAGS